MPLQDEPKSVISIKVWHCKYKSLNELSEYSNLKAVEIATFPDDTMNVIGSLTELEWLRIIHLPKIKALTSLGNLSKLKCLSLATLPSWDASGKVTTVQSLDPLTRIDSLQHLELFGVRPIDKSLSDLYRCKNLKSVRIHKYPKKQTLEYYETTGMSDAFMPNNEFGV